MKIIIEIKDSAGISRIDQLDHRLKGMAKLAYPDVIKSVEKEWCD